MASVFQVFQNYVVWSLMASIGDHLRKCMTASLLRAPYDRYVDGEMASYVGRLSSDVDSIQHMIMDSFRFIIRPIAMLVVMAAVMLAISWQATLVLMLFSPIAIFVTRHMSKSLRESQEAILDKRQGIQAQVSEIIDNIRVIRSYTAESRYRERIKESTRDYTATAVHHVTKRQFVNSVIEIINLLPFLALVGVGAPLVSQGTITVGDFMLFITFEQLLRSPLVQLAHFILHIKAEMAAPDRVQQIIDLPQEFNANAARQEKTASGAITIDSLHFHYIADKPILRGLQVNIAAGERVAIVGNSGAGKSTLFHLLLGLYQPVTGVIRFDGVAMTDWNLAELREHIGVVFQNNPLLDGTIRHNLILDERSIGDEELWQALEHADAAAFVKQLPEGLDTLVGVKGMKLSGGQRQRLAIARAVLRDPKVVLLDEATSSLDSLSEHQIQQALDHLLANRTSLTIAHRLSTVVASDRILYIAPTVSSLKKAATKSSSIDAEPTTNSLRRRLTASSVSQGCWENGSKTRLSCRCLTRPSNYDAHPSHYAALLDDRYAHVFLLTPHGNAVLNQAAIR